MTRLIGFRKACLLLLAAAGCARPDAVRWHTDYAAAVRASAASGLPLFVHLEIAGRPLCRAFDEAAFADPAVIAALADFEAVRVDATRAPRRLVAKAGCRGFVDLVLDPHGRVTGRRSGYARPEVLRSFLRRGAVAVATLARLRRARDLAPSDAAAWLALGSFEATARLPGAARALEHAVSLARRPALRVRGLARLARLATEAGLTAEARATLDRAARIDAAVLQSLPAQALTTATLLFQERRLDELLDRAECLERAAPAGERDALRLVIGRAQHESGADARARMILARLSTSNNAAGACARDLLAHLDEPTHSH